MTQKREEGCAVGLTSIVVFPLLLIWEGFVLKKLWLWFIVPDFDVRPLSLVTAMGILLLVYHVNLKPTPNPDAEPMDLLIWQIVRDGAIPLMLLLVGWLVVTIGA